MPSLCNCDNGNSDEMEMSMMTPSIRYIADFAVLITVISTILLVTTLPTAKASWVAHPANIVLME